MEEYFFISDWRSLIRGMAPELLIRFASLRAFSITCLILVDLVMLPMSRSLKL